MSDLWDKDIAKLNMSEEEKNGLQVFRNYKRSFDDHAEKLFAKEIDAESFDVKPLDRVLSLISSEDVRLLPVITCAYADDLLKAMFKAEMPKGVPGGRSSLFGAYGPLSNLHNRIQLAFVFNMVSPDVAKDLDKVRKVRNDFSHSWDISAFEDFYSRGAISEIYPIDMLLAEQQIKLPEFPKTIEPLQAFRIRLVWLLARLAYETSCYPRANRQRLHPQNALFGQNSPKRLSRVSKLAIKASKKVIES